MTSGAERQRADGFGRLDEGLRKASDWYLWGPYLSECQSRDSPQASPQSC